MKNYVVAVDLGSGNVVVAAGYKGENGLVSVEHISVKESKGVSKGEVRNVEQAAQSIKEAVAEMEEKLGVKINEVYAGISGEHIQCAKHPYYVYVAGKDGEICEDDVKRLNESMGNVQAPDGCRLMHIVPQHYLVDDEEEVDPVGMFGKTLGSTFSLIIGQNARIARLEKALDRIDIKIKKLFINPLVVADAVTFPDEKDSGVAVVDIGAGTTDICIYHDGIVRYVGVIPIGAEAINKDIRSYGILERFVEELKVKYGCAVSSVVEPDKRVRVSGRTPNDYKEIPFKTLASIIEARLTDIVEFVIKEIQDAGYEGKLDAGIVLTGGASLTREIATLFADKTKMPVRIGGADVVAEEESAENVSDPRLSVVMGIINSCIAEGESIKLDRKQPAVQMAKPEAFASKKATVSGNTLKTQPAADPFAEDEFSGGDDQHLNVSEVDDDKTKAKNGAKRAGFWQGIKKRFEKTFDFDVLDDDNTI